MACGENTGGSTLLSLQEDGVHYASIPNREFYVSLESGYIYNKETNDDDDALLTVNDAVAPLWKEYTKGEGKKAEKVTTRYALVNFSGEVEGLYSSLDEALSMAEDLNDNEDDADYSVETLLVQ